MRFLGRKQQVDTDTEWLCPACHVTEHDPIRVTLLGVNSTHYRIHSGKREFRNEPAPARAPGGNYVICSKGHIWTDGLLPEATSLSTYLGTVAGGKSELMTALLAADFPLNDDAGHYLPVRVQRYNVSSAVSGPRRVLGTAAATESESDQTRRTRVIELLQLITGLDERDAEDLMKEILSQMKDVEPYRAQLDYIFSLYQGEDRAAYEEDATDLWMSSTWGNGPPQYLSLLRVDRGGGAFTGATVYSDTPGEILALLDLPLLQKQRQEYWLSGLKNSSHVVGVLDSMMATPIVKGHHLTQDELESSFRRARLSEQAGEARQKTMQEAARVAAVRTKELLNRIALNPDLLSTETRIILVISKADLITRFLKKSAEDGSGLFPCFEDALNAANVPSGDLALVGARLAITECKLHFFDELKTEEARKSQLDDDSRKLFEFVIDDGDGTVALELGRAILQAFTDPNAYSRLTTDPAEMALKLSGAQFSLDVKLPSMKSHIANLLAGKKFQIRDLLSTVVGYAMIANAFGDTDLTKLSANHPVIVVHTSAYGEVPSKDIEIHHVGNAFPGVLQLKAWTESRALRAGVRP